jgi:hypothetical protein
LASGSSSGEENLENIQKSFIFDLAKHQFHAALIVSIAASCGIASLRNRLVFQLAGETVCSSQSMKMVVEKGSRVSLIATGDDAQLANIYVFVLTLAISEGKGHS